MHAHCWPGRVVYDQAGIQCAYVLNLSAHMVRTYDTALQTQWDLARPGCLACMAMLLAHLTKDFCFCAAGACDQAVAASAGASTLQG